MNIRNSEQLLDTKTSTFSHSFSSDGSLFAASQEHCVCVWKYASSCYTLLREFECPGFLDYPLQFSPTSSSILGHSGDILWVWYLNELSATPGGRSLRFVGLSRSGTCVATACHQGNTITIVNLLVQTPPQFIDVDAEIEGLVITGNVLLVQGPQEVIAWLLTKEGLVDGVIGGGRVDRGASIWTVQRSRTFRVEDHVGVIVPDGGGSPHVYHTETGEVLHPTQTPRYSDNRCRVRGL